MVDKNIEPLALIPQWTEVSIMFNICVYLSPFEIKYIFNLKGEMAP